MSKPTPPPRQSADERRVAITQAAVEEFALHGYAGAATEAIARRVGISQPYIFRLFGTKKELFLAASAQVHAKIHAIFAQAADRAEVNGTPPLDAMAQAYGQLLSHKADLLLLLQAFAAGGDPEIQAKVRTSYRALVADVAQRSGAPPEQIFEFFSAGMLLTVAAALDMPEFYGPLAQELER
jgi:AcrR family transcriptional regulator